VLRAAAVTIARFGASTSVSATTDSAGRVRFDSLLTGYYSVSAIRVLTAAEGGGLPPADADVNALGGGATVIVTAPVTDTAVTAIAGRRGSLVISEVSGADPFLPGGGQYRYASFIELYNNSDTTIYLDGMVIGRSMTVLSDYHSPRSCAEMERWRNDPDGIWTKWLNAFPGRGRDHPLAPGQLVVVAEDAINHGNFVPFMPDLSRADFEFIGFADVDNPAVPNMVNIGLGEWPLIGHGLDFMGAPTVAFVTLPLDTSSLPRDFLPMVSPIFERVPRDKILDVLSYDYIPAVQAQLPDFPTCPQLVNAVFDRQYTQVYDPYAIGSMQRRVFARLPDGRAILLRTKTSANDFLFADVTPGVRP
jgi:hypothetical protein